MDKNKVWNHFVFLEHLSMGGCTGISEEVDEYVDTFLKAGIDPKRIMDLLDDERLFYNYDSFVERGAYINLTDLAKRLDKDFVYENLNAFLARVPKKDAFLLEVYDRESFNELCEDFGEDLFFQLICQGVKPQTVFTLADQFLRDLVESPEDLFRMISFLIGYGLDKKPVKEWLSARLHENSFDFLLMLNRYSEVFSKFGVNASNFIGPYLHHYGEEYLRCMTANPLPKWISLNDEFLDCFSMQKIIDIGGIEFVYDFEALGGDIRKLAKKFISEIGYPEEYKEAFYLLVIIECGGANRVNLNQFADCIDASELNPADKECFRETLSKYGVEEEKLAKFN